jgi:diguanylate cyclase (GGDEF)-like protein
MSETNAPAAPVAASSAQPVAHRSTSGFTPGKFLIVVTGLIAVIATAEAMISPGGPAVALSHLLLDSLALLLMFSIVRRDRRAWSVPLTALRQAMADVRNASGPIDSVGQIGGNLADLASEIATLLHELRNQRRQVTELNCEMRDKVAVRTEALERVIGSLRNQAVRDPLTGLFNGRLLDQNLPKLVDQCRADGTRLCALMIDIDHFKILNDTLGHDAGDQLLQSLGRLIRSSLREDDLAFRYGGDEFLILMPGVGWMAGQQLSTRLSRLVDDLARTLNVPRRPALSIGIATLADVPNGTPEALLRRADEALYAEKASRRRQSGPAARESAAASPRPAPTAPAPLIPSAAQPSAAGAPAALAR